MTKQRRGDSPSRGVQEIGRGDYVKIGSHWKRVESNSGQGKPGFPRDPWTIRTEDGGSYGMWDINRYAKAEDMSE